MKPKRHSTRSKLAPHETNGRTRVSDAQVARARLLARDDPMTYSVGYWLDVWRVTRPTAAGLLYGTNPHFQRPAVKVAPVKPHHGAPLGELHGGVKLTLAKVLWILTQSPSRENARIVSEHFDVSESAMWHIWAGRTWGATVGRAIQRHGTLRKALNAENKR